MPLKKKNNESELTKRIVNLDFLRGVFILLALDQHFTYYINMWYVDFFKDTMALSSTYATHFPMIGKEIPTDFLNQLILAFFTPWGSQIYLTMATFNLARKKRELFSEEMPDKFRMYFLIFLFFFFENAIVAPNFGEMISFYPISLWMLVLFLLSLCYRYLGMKGICLLFFLSLTQFFLPIEKFSNGLEGFMRIHIHPEFEYDARLEYFLASGCMGFIMGHVHFYKNEFAKYKDGLFMLLGLGLIGFYLYKGDAFFILKTDVLSTEHDLAKTASGMSYILGAQMFVLSSLLWLEKKEIKLKTPLVNWVGASSLFIFAFHRIIFVKIIAPISIFIGSMTGRILGAGSVEVLLYILITLFLCYFIKKSPMSEIILQKKK